jgi:hypothetical protein
MRRWFGRNHADAPILQESPPERLAICEYDAWHGFMVEVLYPHAARVSLTPGESAAHVFAAIPRAARGVLMHINSSFTKGFVDSEDDLRAALAERGQRVLNLGAVDVRKSTLQACCARLGLTSARANRDGPPNERLIAKTVLNYGGRPERAMRQRWGDRAAPFTSDVSDAVEGHLDYVIATRAEMPAALWSDPTIVIERFFQNPQGFFFRVYVVGPAGVVSAVWVDGDVKKLSVDIRRRHNYFFWTLPAGDLVPLGPSADQAFRALIETRRIAQALEIDFLGADCVIDEQGNTAVVDVNKTPYWGHPRQSPILSHLRHGFNALIGDFT